jgi:hypothetical protein
MKDDRLNSYKFLFKGREDVFALRWEKSGKSSYMPAYSFDPNRYRLHQMKGGTFQTFTDKTYQPLTDDHLIKHLKGEQVVGLYPLLQDNTSWFIAADFDEADWIEECRTFIKICEEHDIPTYLERSRSGKGGHVWLFLKNPMRHSEAEK